MDTLALLPAETLNICAESTCNFEKVVVRKVERIRFTATTPHSFPNSLKATAAVPFLNENGPRVRCPAWIGIALPFKILIDGAAHGATAYQVSLKCNAGTSIYRLPYKRFTRIYRQIFSSGFEPVHLTG